MNARLNMDLERPWHDRSRRDIWVICCPRNSSYLLPTKQPNQASVHVIQIARKPQSWAVACLLAPFPFVLTHVTNSRRSVPRASVRPCCSSRPKRKLECMKTEGGLRNDRHRFVGGKRNQNHEPPRKLKIGTKKKSKDGPGPIPPCPMSSSFAVISRASQPQPQRRNRFS